LNSKFHNKNDFLFFHRLFLSGSLGGSNNRKLLFVRTHLLHATLVWENWFSPSFNSKHLANRGCGRQPNVFTALFPPAGARYLSVKGATSSLVRWWRFFSP